MKNGIRRRWVRCARTIGYPIHTPHLPRPPLARRRRHLRLTHVLVASDLNPRYLGSWELIRRGWLEICDVEPLLVLIANERDAPADLLADPLVRLFPPLDGVHSALQAQCIRLLYPALVATGGGVLVSDMELVPLDARYFHGPLRRLDDRFFVTYRDILLHMSMIAIGYNVARPETWGELFDIASLDDVRARLGEWADGREYTGDRGGEGWYTDQRILFATAMPWGERTGRLWTLDDEHAGYNRLNRTELEAEGGLAWQRRREILRRRYSDYNSAIPHHAFRELNETVLELGIAAARSSTAKVGVDRLRLRSA